MVQAGLTRMGSELCVSQIAQGGNVAYVDNADPTTLFYTQPTVGVVLNPDGQPNPRGWWKVAPSSSLRTTGSCSTSCGRKQRHDGGGWSSLPQAPTPMLMVCATGDLKNTSRLVEAGYDAAPRSNTVSPRAAYRRPKTSKGPFMRALRPSVQIAEFLASQFLSSWPF